MDWKNEFLKLYMSSTAGSLDKALELKRNHLPQKLYRYRKADNLEHLKNEICKGRIFLSSPSIMNDPFDSCSLLSEHNPSMYAQTKIEYAKKYKNILDDKTFKKIFGSDNWLEELVAYIATKYVSIEQVDSAKGKVLELIMSGMEEINSDINDIISKTSRIACFTEKAFNLPMWNHYANGHKGVCLEYSIDSIQNIQNTNRLFPVKYTEKLPDGLLLLKEQKSSNSVFLEYFLMHKLIDWHYESEWRLIYDIGAWHNDPNKVHFKFFENAVPIKFALPSTVYLGAEISKTNENEIRKWCSEHSISVQKMQCTEYGLKAIQ